MNIVSGVMMAKGTSYLFIPFSPFKKKLYKEKWVVIDIPDTCIQNMYEVHSIKNANLSIKYE